MSGDFDFKEQNNWRIEDSYEVVYVSNKKGLNVVRVYTVTQPNQCCVWLLCDAPEFILMAEDDCYNSSDLFLTRMQNQENRENRKRYVLCLSCVLEASSVGKWVGSKSMVENMLRPWQQGKTSKQEMLSKKSSTKQKTVDWQHQHSWLGIGHFGSLFSFPRNFLWLC